MRFQRFQDFGSVALLQSCLLCLQPLIRFPTGTFRCCCMEIFADVIEIEQETSVHSKHSVCLVRDPRGSVPQAVNRTSFVHARTDCTIEPMIPCLLRPTHGSTKDRSYRSFRTGECQPAFLPGHLPILAFVSTSIATGVCLHNWNHGPICFRHKRCHGSFLGDFRVQSLHLTHSASMFLCDATFGSRRYRNAIMLAQFLACFFERAICPEISHLSL